MAKYTKETALETAVELVDSIENLDKVLERANKCLIPEKDGVLTRERLIGEITKRLRKTGYFIKVTEHGDDTKLAGFKAISTSQKGNCNCEKLSKIAGTICQKCYAHIYLNMRRELRMAMAINYVILTQHLLEDDEIPIIRTVFARIESFGDLEMVKNGGLIQSRNYTRIVKKNFRTYWGWWTKHPELMQKGIDAEGGKPCNLKCVYSSPFINKEIVLEKLREKCPCIDKIFTVFDKPFIKANNIQINCGSRDCWNCGICYTNNTIKYVREVLK
jgi:hypothetical protein